MNLTVRHLEYLISRHDCVIVPGLGAVLARKSPARENKEQGYWMAPCRNYSFNSDLNETDGLLAGSVARSLRISHERAGDLVASEVTAMKSQLEREGSLSLGRVGRLAFDDASNIVFEGAVDTLSPFAGWYPKYDRRPLDIMDVVGEDEQEASVNVLTPFGRFMRIAAAVIVLVAVGLALSTPVSVDDVQYASLGIPAPKAPSAQTQLKNDAVNDAGDEEGEISVVLTSENVAYVGQQSLEKNRSLKDSETMVSVQDTKALNNPVKVKKAANASAVRLNDFDEYCLVVASLVSEDAAERFILDESRRNPGLAMGILEQNGRYRVYAATGTSKAQAMSAASSPKISRYKGVWVTRR